MGIEVEYSISHLPGVGTTALAGETVSKWLAEMAEQELRRSYGNAYFWPNGGKLYYDLGHLEWAGPECRSAREAVVYDRAGERFLARIAELAEPKLAQNLCPGTLFVAKNNVDARGNSFGCHENYLIQRRTDLLPDDQEFFRYLTRHLTPFLVSRTVLCGSGWVNSAGFQVSQRAGFINQIVSADTTVARPIINTRDEVHGSIRYRRLHLILGDANMCEWSTFLKLGTTVLVLEMIEDVFLSNSPDLSDPVAALHTISGDPELAQSVPLRNGRSMNAVEIQRWYLEAAKRYFSSDDGDEAGQILETWEQTLSGLAVDLKSLRGKVDWVTKLAFLESHRDRSGTSNDMRLRELDMKYHDVRPQTSAFYVLAGAGLIHSMVDTTEVERAQNEPPAFTRARVRGEAVRRQVVAQSWDGITVAGRSVNLPDPLDWCPVEALKLLGFSSEELFKWLRSGLENTDAQIRVQALRVLPITGDFRAAQALPFMDDKCAQVRAEAAKVIGALRDQGCLEILRRACSDASFLVRYEARKALTALGSNLE